MCSSSIKDQNHPIPRGVRFVATIKAKNFMNENNGRLRKLVQEMEKIEKDNLGQFLQEEYKGSQKKFTSTLTVSLHSN